MDKNSLRENVPKVDLLRLRHEAPKVEPTVHGSWPREFLFYKSGTQKTYKCLAHILEEIFKRAEYPVKASGTPSHIGLGPC